MTIKDMYRTITVTVPVRATLTVRTNVFKRFPVSCTFVVEL